MAGAGEAHVLRLAARAAEDAGDLEGALRLVSQLPQGPDERRWRSQLEAAAQLEPSDSARLALWLVNPALRWARERPAGEAFERHARLMLSVLGASGPDRDREVEEIAVKDPVVVDAALFDEGLFARYLAEGAAGEVVERAGPAADWDAQPVSVVRLEQVSEQAVQLCDLWDDQRVVCLPWESRAPGHAIGALLYGRLLPVMGEVPLAFALSPVTVDRRCAARILRARRRRAQAQERLRAVARSRCREAQARSA